MVILSTMFGQSLMFNNAWCVRLPIHSFWVALLTSGQSFDCPGVSLEDLGGVTKATLFNISDLLEFLYQITLISAMCGGSSAAATPVGYDRDI